MVITKNYNLCNNCYNRLFSKYENLKHDNDYKVTKLIHTDNTKICYICKNIFRNLEYYIMKIFEITKCYEFSTFSVGLIIKPSMVDRDDDIRSKFKLIGSYSIKYNLNNEISKLFSRKTKLKTHKSPDLVITLDFKQNTIETRSKTIYIYGKYVKKSRNIQQKQIVCMKCGGVGCIFCHYMGISEFNSIGGKIIKFLHDKFISTTIKINYVGGEDKSSLVLGDGRPFFAKIINPKIRNTILHEIIDNNIKIHNLRIIKYMPTNIFFKSKVKITISTKKIINRDDLNILNNIKSITITDADNKKNVKIIHWLDWKLLTDMTFSMVMIIDGGFPVKKFINDRSVIPNISDSIQNTCKCINCDYYEILML